MQVPLQVSFRHMEHSETIEELIREKVAKLDASPDHIMGCRVVVEPAGKHHEHGNLYEVRIDITVPGEEIVVTRGPFVLLNLGCALRVVSQTLTSPD